MTSFSRRKIHLTAFFIIFGAGIVVVAFIMQQAGKEKSFMNGNNILEHVNRQLNYGSRYPGSPGHEKVQQFLIAEMEAHTGEAVVQSLSYTASDGQKYGLKNIVGRLNPSEKRRVILATHYDSRRFADNDATRPDQPVPGANDSASGAALLVELTKSLSKQTTKPSIGIDFIFFDGEEGDPSKGADHDKWEPLGSTYFATHLAELYGDTKPESAVVLDMVCDKNLKIYKEQSSVRDAPAQVDAFWNAARKVNSDIFRPETKYHIRDDHTPLNQVGIPSILVIDFDYPPFHTIEDTIDKCSADSLETVAHAVLKYIYSIPSNE